MDFPLHERFPPVIPLAVHLENGQRVYFTEQTAMERATARPPPTTLTEFFALCQRDAFAQTLTYPEVPRFYTWDQSRKVWSRRKQGNAIVNHPGIFEAQAIGRVYTVSPRQGESYYLRLLLHEVKGPQNFDDVKKVSGSLCQTFREACQRRGLMDDDNHLKMALEEAASCRSPCALRSLFAMILTACEPAHPLSLWLLHRDSMTEDILNSHQQELSDNGIQVTDHMYNQCLCQIQDKVFIMGGQKLDMYGLPLPDTSAGHQMPREYFRQVNYDREEQEAFSAARQQQLTEDQSSIYTTFMSLVEAAQGGMVFVDAPGGTGKTYLMNLILSTVRSHGHITLATASSGIAATLLTGGRTLHSTSKIPLNVTGVDTPMCAIKRGTALAKVINDCCAIIMDEAPMTHRLAFEAMDRTLRDITGKDCPMGGIPTLFCGDFRQILPVIPRGTRANIVDASLRKSYLWQFITVMRLHTNMRVHLQSDTSAGDFASLLLSIGDGAFPLTDHPDFITVPRTIAIQPQSLEDLIQSVYPQIEINARDSKWLGERAILAPLNSMVNTINNRMVHDFPGELLNYSSVDSAIYVRR